MTFEQYLLYIGRDYEEHGYEQFEVFSNIDYFKECYKRNIDPKLSLEWLYDHINGEEIFEK